MTRNGHIAAAVEELLAEREHLQARLTKVEAAIAAVRDAFHLPAERRQAAKASRGSTNGNVAPRRPRSSLVTIDAVQAALRGGPVSPGELARTLGVERAALRYALKGFEQRGLIVSTGTTSTRRVSLPSQTAKEAP